MSRWLEYNKNLLDDIAEEKPELLRSIAGDLIEKLEDKVIAFEMTVPAGEDINFSIDKPTKGRTANVPNIIDGESRGTMKDAADFLHITFEKYKMLKKAMVLAAHTDMMEYIKTRPDVDDLLEAYRIAENQEKARQPAWEGN